MQENIKILFKDIIVPEEMSGGPINARERSRLETRRRLLEAGAELFSKKGFEKTTISAIAAEAQVATGTLFFHFKNKEGLLIEIALHYFNKLHDRIRKSNLRPAKNVEHSVFMHTETIVNFFEENKSLMSIIINQMTTGSKSWETFSQVWVNEQIDRLKEGMAEGLFRNDIDLEIAAEGILGMRLNVLSWWLNHQPRPNKEKIIDTLAKMTYSGIYNNRQRK